MARATTPKLGNSHNVATSYLVATCATLAAILLFAVLGSQILPGALGFAQAVPAAGAMVTALILNIALVLFGWRRARDLAETVEQLKQAESEAYINAFTDHLTGLHNRRALIREIDAAFARADCEDTLLLLDVDHFKKVNDLYGHGAGDLLLQLVGTKLVDTLPPSAFVARLGGDEFAALVHGIDEAHQSAEKIIGAFGQPMEVGEHHVQISISAGIAALRPGTGRTDILRQADVAMYSVKQSGRNGFAWFDEEMEQQVRARVLLEDEIRSGIDRDEFVPFFQPLISLDTGELNGFEVLARWDSSKRGLIEPDGFIKLAEQCGQISALSMRVMEKAFIEARNWPSHLKLAVNISPVQFRDPHLAEQILKLLTATGFPARRLELEISEGSLMEDRAQALTILQSLRNNGISIALDDFGTGYASLSQLDALPFDRIKIDRSFIGSLAENEQAAAIVQTITALGKTLSVPITAEGIESDALRQQMTHLGCTDAQGWHFGKPVSGSIAGMRFNPAGGADDPELEPPGDPGTNPSERPVNLDSRPRRSIAGRKS